MVEHDLGTRVGGCSQRLFSAIEMALGIGEAAHPYQRHSVHRECAGRHGLARPAVLLGNSECPLAQLERERQRLAGERRCYGEVGKTADLDERSRNPARPIQRVLEVLPCGVVAARPQLHDP